MANNNIVNFKQKDSITLGRVIETGDKKMISKILNELLEKLYAKSVTQDGELITVSEFQEVILEDVIDLCDLLDHSELYLNK